MGALYLFRQKCQYQRNRDLFNVIFPKTCPHFRHAFSYFTSSGISSPQSGHFPSGYDSFILFIPSLYGNRAICQSKLTSPYVLSGCCESLNHQHVLTSPYVLSGCCELLATSRHNMWLTSPYVLSGCCESDHVTACAETMSSWLCEGPP